MDKKDKRDWDNIDLNLEKDWKLEEKDLNELANLEEFKNLEDWRDFKEYKDLLDIQKLEIPGVVEDPAYRAYRLKAETTAYLKMLKRLIILMLPKDLIQIQEAEEEGFLRIWIKPEANYYFIHYFKNFSLCRFNYVDVTCLDRPQDSERYSLRYILYNEKYRARLIVECSIKGGQPIESIYSIFDGSLGAEKEIYDLFGIIFNGHPDLRRLLLDYGFAGHPLNKDFPLTGYVEIIYDEETKSVSYKDLELSQEFRSFEFLTPWDDKKGTNK